MSSGIQPRIAEFDTFSCPVCGHEARLDLVEEGLHCSQCSGVFLSEEMKKSNETDQIELSCCNSDEECDCS